MLKVEVAAKVLSIPSRRIVMETIEFEDDKYKDLLQPMTLEEFIRRRKVLAMDEEEEIAEFGKEVEMEMDEEEAHLVEESLKTSTGEENFVKAQVPLYQLRKYRHLKGLSRTGRDRKIGS